MQILISSDQKNKKRKLLRCSQKMTRLSSEIIYHYDMIFSLPVCQILLCPFIHDNCFKALI